MQGTLLLFLPTTPFKGIIKINFWTFSPILFHFIAHHYPQQSTLTHRILVIPLNSCRGQNQQLLQTDRQAEGETQRDRGRERVRERGRERERMKQKNKLMLCTCLHTFSQWHPSTATTNGHSLNTSRIMQKPEGCLFLLLLETVLKKIRLIGP